MRLNLKVVAYSKLGIAEFLDHFANRIRNDVVCSNATEDWYTETNNLVIGDHCFTASNDVFEDDKDMLTIDPDKEK